MVDSGVDGSVPGVTQLSLQVPVTSLSPNGAGRRSRPRHARRLAWPPVRAGGYTGSLPSAKLVSLDVFDDAGNGTIGDVIAAADWIYANAATYKIRLANFSLTGSVASSFTSDPLDRAVERLWTSGIVVVAAAGNDAVNGVQNGVQYAPATTRS